jgi:hypothetical protein
VDCLIAGFGYWFDLLHEANVLAPVCATLQKLLLSSPRGTLPDGPYHLLLAAFSRGPGPVSVGIFRFFGEIFVCPTEDAAVPAMLPLLCLLKEMMPTLPRTIVEGFPPDQYLFDNAAIGFLRTPKLVKVIAGDAVFPPDYPHAAARDWLIEFLTPDAFLLCLESNSLLHAADLAFIAAEAGFWRRLCAVVGPGISKLIAPHIHETESNEFMTTLTAVVGGLHSALRHFPVDARQPAVSAVILPFLRLLAAKPDPTTTQVFSSLVEYLLADLDFRRVAWMADFAVELLADPARLTHGLTILAQLYRQSHFSFHDRLLPILREHVMPRVTPLSAISIPALRAFATVCSGQIHLGLGRGVELATLRIVFGNVFDRELGRSDDRFAMLLDWLEPPVGHEAILPLIAERIVQIFRLRDAVSSPAETPIEAYIQWIAGLNWYLVPDKLDAVLTALRTLFPGASQAVRPLIVEFLHRVAFGGILRLPAAVHRRIFDECIPMFVASEVREVRDGAIGIARMMIPIAFASPEAFWREAVEKNTGKLAAANGIALLGATFVLQRIPIWLPELLELLEQLHKKEPVFAKRIEEEFAGFWAMVGAQEFPEIEDYRFAFSASYCS